MCMPSLEAVSSGNSPKGLKERELKALTRQDEAQECTATQPPRKWQGELTSASFRFTGLANTNRHANLTTATTCAETPMHTSLACAGALAHRGISILAGWKTNCGLRPFVDHPVVWQYVASLPACGERGSRMEVLLVDDHAFVRQALYMLFDEPDIEIAGEGANGREAVALMRHLQPDVVLMDVSMPV